jgi:hypothetical protein
MFDSQYSKFSQNGGADEEEDGENLHQQDNNIFKYNKKK